MRSLERKSTGASARVVGQRSIAAYLDKAKSLGKVDPAKDFAMSGLKRATSASRKK
jgi:hypothetical protein